MLRLANFFMRLEARLSYALIGLVQATGYAGGLDYDFTAVLIESRNTTKRLKRNSVTALTSIVGTRIANSFQPCCASASPHQIESGVNTR